jgi:hypothetical protein
MTPLPPGVKVHLAFGYIDMRKGIDGLAMLVQGVLRAGSVLGPSIRVPGSLRWHRTLPFHQVARARRVPMALERRSWLDADADLGAVVDVIHQKGPSRVPAGTLRGPSIGHVSFREYFVMQMARYEPQDCSEFARLRRPMERQCRRLTGKAVGTMQSSSK